MKQALNRLALYCAAQGAIVMAGRDGFSIRKRCEVAHAAQAISVDELADRVEAMNSAPVHGDAAAQAAMRTLMANGYEYRGGAMWAPVAGAQPHFPSMRVLGACGYDGLADVLHRAFQQAASGKGKERHASDGKAFEKQPMSAINEVLGSVDGYLYQAMKKATEAKRLPPGRDVAELLGAINYLAGAVLHMERHRAQPAEAANEPNAKAAANA